MKSNDLKAAIIVPSFNIFTGGVSAAVRGLTLELHQRLGNRLRVCGPEEKDVADPIGRWGCDAWSLFSVNGPRSFAYMPELFRDMISFSPDVGHTVGLWMYPSVVMGRWASQTHRPYMVSPHGMLAPWALRNRAWKKRLATWLYEGSHLKRAACLHALCQAEATAIRNCGLKNPVCIVPNGVELPLPSTTACASPLSGRHMLLYLGRLHPIKNVPSLLTAWARSRSDEASIRNEWELVLAGTGPLEHVEELRLQAQALNMDETAVRFVGLVKGEAKDSLFRTASAFVLPSFSEGVPMGVLEAWSYGLPVVMSSACNPPEGFKVGAALCGGPDVDSLTKGLSELCRMSDADRGRIGEKGLRLVRDKFTWQHVAEQMIAVYVWLAGGGEPPDCVE